MAPALEYIDRAIVHRRPTRSARYPTTGEAISSPPPYAARATPESVMENPFCRRYRTRKGTTNDPKRLMKDPAIRTHAWGESSRMFRRSVRRPELSWATGAPDRGEEEATPRRLDRTTDYFTKSHVTTSGHRMGRRRLAHPGSAARTRCAPQPRRPHPPRGASSPEVDAAHALLGRLAVVPDRRGPRRPRRVRHLRRAWRRGQTAPGVFPFDQG